MEDPLNLAIALGPKVLALGLLVAAACGAIRWRSTVHARPSMPRYLGRLLLVGLVAFVGGAALGIAAFCSTDDAGNLCGLGGVFGMGPLLSGICIGVYACAWFARTRDAP